MNGTKAVFGLAALAGVLGVLGLRVHPSIVSDEDDDDGIDDS